MSDMIMNKNLLQDMTPSDRKVWAENNPMKNALYLREVKRGVESGLTKFLAKIAALHIFKTRHVVFDTYES